MLQARAALADEDRGGGPLGHDRTEGRQVDALVAAAGDEHDRRREGAQGGDHRIGLGPLRVVDEADAVDDRHGLEPVLDSGEGRRRDPDRVRGDPEQERDGDRRQRVRDVVPAGDDEVRDRHDPAARTGGRRPPAGQRQSLDVGGHDPAVDDAEPAAHRAIVPVEDGAGAPEPGIAGHDRVVGVEDERPERVHLLGEAALDRSIRLHGAVPVEVVRGHVGERRDRGPPGEGRQLQLGELDHDPIAGAQVGQPLDQGPADVPAQERPVRRVGRQQRVGQGGGRRLALRPGDPDRRRRAQAEDEVGLRDQGRNGPVAGRPAGDQVDEDGPQARLGRRVVRVDRRRRGHEGGAADGLARVDIRPGQQPDPPPVEPRGGAAQVVGRSPVVDRDRRPGVDEEAGQGDPAPGEAQDGHRQPPQGPLAETLQAELVGLDDRGRRRADGVGGRARSLGRHRRHPSALMEARKRVTPRSPASTPTIHSRTVIFSSCQPSSSK